MAGADYVTCEHQRHEVVLAAQELIDAARRAEGTIKVWLAVDQVPAQYAIHLVENMRAFETVSLVASIAIATVNKVRAEEEQLESVA